MLWVKVLRRKVNVKAKPSTSNADAAADAHTTSATNVAAHAALAKPRPYATTNGRQRLCLGKESPKQSSTLLLSNNFCRAIVLAKSNLDFSQKIFEKEKYGFSSYRSRSSPYRFSQKSTDLYSEPYPAPSAMHCLEWSRLALSLGCRDCSSRPAPF
jgi:hypothetical protein